MNLSKSIITFAFFITAFSIVSLHCMEAGSESMVVEKAVQICTWLMAKN